MKTENYYNGKTHLLVTYQYHVFEHGDIIQMVSRDFDTLDEAYAEMERIMPNCYEADDGYDIDEWLRIMAEDDDIDIYEQYAARIDSEHYMLAELRPVISEEVSHE